MGDGDRIHAPFSQGFRRERVPGAIGDHTEADRFADAGQLADDRIFCPGETAGIAKQNAGRPVLRQPAENGLRLGDQINHTGLVFSFRFVRREDDEIVVKVTGFNGSGFQGTAAGKIEKVEQFAQRSGNILSNELPLLRGIENVASFPFRLLHPLDWVAVEIFLLDRPVQHSLHDTDDIILRGRADGQAFVPFGNVVYPQLGRPHSPADAVDERLQVALVQSIGRRLAVRLAPVEVDLGKLIESGKFVLDLLAIGH